MSAKLPGKKRKLKQQEKLFEEAEEKKSKKQVIVFERISGISIVNFQWDLFCVKITLSYTFKKSRSCIN